MKKKRRLNRKLLLPLKIIGIICTLVIVLSVVYIFVFNNPHFIGVKSQNRDAKKYETKTCIAFYPNTKGGVDVAKELCESSEEERIYDYALIQYGDYYLVEYGNNVHYYIDSNFKPLKVDSISDEGIKILSEYLRYDMKRDEINEAYTLKFINDTKPENLDLTECKYSIEEEYLAVYFPKYDYTVKVPLKYMQEATGINLGYKNELYIKPKYISPNRKIVAFTFDDGPNTTISPLIIDTFYQYDSVATYFVVGNMLTPSTIEIVEDSINKGNQYGSHTQSHPYLVLLDEKEAYDQIMQPAIDLRDGYHEGSEYDFDGLGYMMNIYRAPYGEHNATLDSIAPFMSIEWDCDSRDWAIRDGQGIVDSINDFKEKNRDALDGCIVLFHDMYQETADAMKILVPQLIEEGYQFVTVSELLDILKVDKTKAYYPW